MVGEVFAGLGAFKTMFDLAKGLKDIHDAAQRNAAVIDLQEKILAAQMQQATLIESVGELEKEVARLKAWDTEKQRYEFKDIGQGAMAYSIKPDMQGTEPPHHICANCYNQSKKRILQHTFLDVGRAETYACHDCGSTLYVSGHWEQAHQPRSGGGKHR